MSVIAGDSSAVATDSSVVARDAVDSMDSMDSTLCTPGDKENSQRDSVQDASDSGRTTTDSVHSHVRSTEQPPLSLGMTRRSSRPRQKDKNERLFVSASPSSTTLNERQPNLLRLLLPRSPSPNPNDRPLGSRNPKMVKLMMPTGTDNTATSAQLAAKGLGQGLSSADSPLGAIGTPDSSRRIVSTGTASRQHKPPPGASFSLAPLAPRPPVPSDLVSLAPKPAKLRLLGPSSAPRQSIRDPPPAPLIASHATRRQNISTMLALGGTEQRDSGGEDDIALAHHPLFNCDSKPAEASLHNGTLREQPPRLKPRRHQSLHKNKNQQPLHTRHQPRSHPPRAPVANADVVNEDFCGACGGTGSFICCDSCPRSFHFECAEPPVDPANLPESDWFCCACLAQGSDVTPTITRDPECLGFDVMWRQMLTDVLRANPRSFVMPRRFRYQERLADKPSTEEELNVVAVRTETREETEPSNLSSVSSLSCLANGDALTSSALTSSSLASSSLASSSLTSSALTSSAPQEDTAKASLSVPSTKRSHHKTTSHGHALLHKAPNISALKRSDGFCHCCGQFGVTRRLLEEEASEDLAGGTDVRLARPLQSCSICPLYWHLDCLNPPLPVFSASGDRWICPIHFTEERCLALDLAAPLVTAIHLLPEEAIRLQFRRKREREQEREWDREHEFESENGREEHGQMRERASHSCETIIVPDFVKLAYCHCR